MPAGIPTNFPKANVVVHPAYHNDSPQQWEARNPRYVQLTSTFFALFDDAWLHPGIDARDVIKSRVHHRDTWHGTDRSDWLYQLSLSNNPFAIGKSTCAAYYILDSRLKQAAELFTLNSKKGHKKMIARLGNDYFDLLDHRERWSFDGTTYTIEHSLFTEDQLMVLKVLKKKCMPQLGEERSRQDVKE